MNNLWNYLTQPVKSRTLTVLYTALNLAVLSLVMLLLHGCAG